MAEVSSQVLGWNSSPMLLLCSLGRRQTGLNETDRKSRRLCHSIRDPQSLVDNVARQLVGWADTARFELPDQCGTAIHAKSHGRTDLESQCMGSPSSPVRKSEVDILEHSTKAAPIRDTH